MDEITLASEKDSLNSQEKELTIKRESVSELEYPDGGLRAWLIVLGVSLLLL